MKRVLPFLAIALFAVVGFHLASPKQSTCRNMETQRRKIEIRSGTGTKEPDPHGHSARDGVKYAFEGVGADGKPVAYGFSVQFDGKDNPISGSLPSGADSISAKRGDSNHYVATLKKGGKVIGTTNVSISNDGRVTTVEATGSTATGVKTHDVQVLDKQ